MSFSFPAYLDRSVVGELENYIIDICNSCPTLDLLKPLIDPLWTWAGQVLGKSQAELRHEIETHEADESFTDTYQEEKDHLLKLPLLILERLNSQF